MNLTAEERELGKENFNRALGITRREWLAAAAAGVPVGAFYFGYQKPAGNPVKAGLIGSGDEGNILIHEHNPEYLEFVGFSDIRPKNRKMTMKGEGKLGKFRMGLERKYGKETAAAIASRSEEKNYHQDYKNILADDDVEMIVIALPLHLHAKVAIEAMEAGKHVLCEKLMARTVGECKEMIAASKKYKRLLAIGHQRHYSVLYDNAVHTLKSGVLGDIRYIDAQWHRNNTWPRLIKNPKTQEREPVRDANGRFVLNDSWKKPIPAEDTNVNYTEYGYESLEELVRWRLYNRTGGGLMVELGSHQMDAASIFLARGVYGTDHPIHPIAVSGVGLKSFYDDDRECDDHIFLHFEFPGPDYGNAKNREDIVLVNYSSINTNKLDAWGETIYGTRGTMVVHREEAALLYKEQGAGGKPPTETRVTVKERDGGGADMDTMDTRGDVAPEAEIAAAQARISRGYREEMEHFGSVVKRYEEGRYEDLYNELRCNGTIAMGDAVMALTANIAMKKKKRIEFKEEWFDPNSPLTPEDDEGIKFA